MWIAKLINLVWKNIFSINIPYFNISFGTMFLMFFIAGQLAWILHSLNSSNGD